MAITSAPRRGGRAAHRSRLALTAAVGLAAIAAGLTGCGGSTGSTVQGSGVAATQARTLAGFSRVELAGDAKVTVVVGGRQSVVVHGDSNLVGHVTTRVVGGSLIVDTTGNFTARSPMSVDISVPSLTALELSGTGKLSASGIDVPSLTVALSGTGALNASGTAARLDVTLEGSGQAELSQLAARDVRAVVAGSGLIRVTATTSLNAAVPGEGAIIYGGSPPQVISSITGAGTVTPG